MCSQTHLKVVELVPIPMLGIAQFFCSCAQLPQLPFFGRQLRLSCRSTLALYCLFRACRC